MAEKVLIATYSQTGSTKRVADQLKNIIPGADTFEIKVPAGTFPNDMFATDDVAKKQIANGNFPELVGALPDFSQYDLVLVGSPVWSAAPATPIHTFLEKLTGFSGKVATFYTHAGTPGAYEQVFKKWAQGLNVLPGHAGNNNLQQWVNQLLY